MATENGGGRLGRRRHPSSLFLLNFFQHRNTVTYFDKSLKLECNKISMQN